MSYEQTKRILVLEDDPETGSLIETCLTEAGYIVHLAKAIPRALHLIDDLAFDAAVLDYCIGTNTAIQVAQSLRVRLIPFVFCTKHDDLPVEFEDVPVLGKPFAPEEMLGMVHSVFGPPRLSRQAVGQ